MRQRCVFTCFELVFVVVAASAADAPLAASGPIGWATAGEGTTGGGDGPVLDAADAETLARLLQPDTPKTICVRGPIVLKDNLRVGTDTTLVGVGADAKLTGGGLHIRKTHNVIVRNLAITEASDAVGIEESHHVWIDHCDFSNCHDGLVDIKRGSDFVTVSWNHFHDHHKTCLLGHSDKPDIRAIDTGHLRVTYHHNFFHGTQTRHPRVRFADGVHVFNNYFLDNEYGVASVMDAGVIVEGNVFENVERPTLTAYGDSPDPGRLVARDNWLIRSGTIETRGGVDESLLTYKYTLDPVDSVAQLVRNSAGPSRADENTAAAHDQPAQPVYTRSAKPDQTEPAEELRVQAISEELRKEYRLDPFYKKAVAIDGIPIIGSENVSDFGFLECAWVVDQMLDGRDHIKRSLVENKVRIGIIAATEYTMDIPENQNLRMTARGAYHDRRSRGLGGYTLATCGEENLLDLRGDPYRLENITIHEFSHTIASNLRRVDRAWWDRLDKLYRQAMDEGLWASSYAATNVQEYWAEGTQSWFDCNTPRDDGRVHNGIWNREKLKQYDPRLAEFLQETFGDRPWRYSKPTDRPADQRAHLEGLDRDKRQRFSFENSPRIQSAKKQPGVPTM